MLRNLLAIYLIFITQFTYGSSRSQEAWKTLQNGPALLFCHQHDLDTGKEILGILQSSLPRISSDLKLTQIRRITIIITPTEKEFQKMTSGSIPDWGIAAANPSNGTIYLKSPRFARPEIDLKSVVIHELSHVLLGMALDGQYIDRWFDEGFAVYQSGEASMSNKVLFARSLVTNNPIHLSQIDAVLTFQRDKAGLAYQESHAAIDYLIQQFGTETISNIVQQIRLSNDMDLALQHAIGMNQDTFESLWLKAMRNKYQWYIIFEFPVLFSALLILFFITAWMVTRKRINKRKKLWDEEETKEALKALEKNSTLD